MEIEPHTDNEPKEERVTKRRLNKKTNPEEARGSLQEAEPKVKEDSVATLGQKWKRYVERRIHDIRGKVHASHHLEGNENFAWCTVCGSYTITRLNKLTKPCERATERGQQNLSSIRKGRIPGDGQGGSKGKRSRRICAHPFPGDVLGM